MRISFLVSVLFAVLASGCAEKKTEYPSGNYAPGVTPKSAPSTSITNRNLIVTLDPSTTGKVAKASASGRFVVMNFPFGHVPARDQQLSLYRHGIKVGEVKVTGPQQDDNTVADIVSGDAQDGDEVRDR